MSTFWTGQIEAGRQLRLYHHRTIAPVNGALIHAPKAQVVIQGSTNVVSPSPASSNFGTVINLVPGVAGTERALILYIGGMNRVTPATFEITVVRSGGNDVFLAEMVGDLLTTATEKGDYYLALYFTHSTTSISFRQSEGDGTAGNSYTYKAIYGPAFFRQEALNV